MTKHLRWLVVVLSVVLLVAAACGDDDDDNASSSGSSTTTAQKIGGSVEVAGVWTGDELASFRKVLDAFTAKTGVNATFTSTGDDIATVLGTRLSGGNPPEVAILPQPGLLADLAGRNALKPIEEVAGKDVDANYAKSWRDLGSVNGTLYGVWYKAADKSTVWYRPKALKDAGLEVPKTWDDMVRASQALSDAGTTPWSIGGADGWTLTDWFENVYLRSAGPDKYDQLTKHQIPWTDDSVKKALTTLGQIWGKSTWIAGGNSGALQNDMPASVTNVFGDPPKAAMVYEGDFVAGVITGQTKAALGTDADYFDFPTIDGNGGVVGGGDVAVMMKDTPQARALVQFLATPEAAEIWAKQGGFTSPNKNVDPAAYPTDIAKRGAKALTDASVFRFDMSDQLPSAFGGTPGQGEWQLLQKFLGNPSDVDGTAQALESAAAAATK